MHPSYDEDGLRIELFGDEVDRLCRFNIVTGEVIKEVEELTIAPAKHFVTKEENRAGMLQRIQMELTDRLAELDKEGKVLESARLSSRTRYDMEMLSRKWAAWPKATSPAKPRSCNTGSASPVLSTTAR